MWSNSNGLFKRKKNHFSLNNSYMSCSTAKMTAGGAPASVLWLSPGGCARFPHSNQFF